MNPTTLSLSQAVTENPWDADLRLVYADALDDDEYIERSEYRWNLALQQRNAALLLKGPVALSRPFPPKVEYLKRSVFYEGHKVSLQASKEPPNEREWDEGSYTFRHFRTVLGTPLRPTYSVLQKNKAVCCLQEIFLGKHIGLTIYGHPDTLLWMLPLGLDLGGPILSWAERVVLAATRSLKSSYQGIRNYRWYEARRITDIGPLAWTEAVESLKEKKLLTKTGALTPKGRNASGRDDLHNLTKETKR